jgi:hypothetical protein
MIGKVAAGIGFVLIACSAIVYAGSSLDIEEGQWEITSSVKMQGMTIPPMTFSQCITKEDAIPRNEASGQDACKVTDQSIVGDTVSWTMVCSGQGGEMKGKGKITYHGDRFEGQMSTESMGMVMLTEMKGKRIGPCQ